MKHPNPLLISAFSHLWLSTSLSGDTAEGMKKNSESVSGEEKTYAFPCDEIIFAPASDPVVRQVSMSANAPCKVSGDKFESSQQKLSPRLSQN